jgi:hypothetical protein
VPSEAIVQPARIWTGSQQVGQCESAIDIGLASFAKDSRSPWFDRIGTLAASRCPDWTQTAGSRADSTGAVLASSGPERLPSSQRFGACTFRPCCLLTVVRPHRAPPSLSSLRIVRVRLDLANLQDVPLRIYQCSRGPTPARSRAATSRRARAAGAAESTTGLNHLHFGPTKRLLNSVDFDSTDRGPQCTSYRETGMTCRGSVVGGAALAAVARSGSSLNPLRTRSNDSRS